METKRKLHVSLAALAVLTAVNVGMAYKLWFAEPPEVQIQPAKVDDRTLSAILAAHWTAKEARRLAEIRVSQVQLVATREITPRQRYAIDMIGIRKDGTQERGTAEMQVTLKPVRQCGPDLAQADRDACRQEMMANPLGIEVVEAVLPPWAVRADE
jgi:hypothetical protein